MRKSSLLVVLGRVIVSMLIVMARILVGCVPNKMPPTSTEVIIEYWLTPTQYSTLETPPPTETSIPELSTLDLIDQAFKNGGINAEQRLLYLAYALYEYESCLPNSMAQKDGAVLLQPGSFIRP